MVYQNKLVACVKVNGQILRESGSSVTLPFGAEYSILIKNLNSVRVQARVSVDGVDATEGTSLIIAPNSTLELERFIKGGNLNSGNRFKFIERTLGIEKHRGIKTDDGIIRVEYKTEKVTITEDVTVRRHVVYDYYDPWWWHYPYVPRPWYHWSGSIGYYQGGQTFTSQSGAAIGQAQNAIGQVQTSSQNSCSVEQAVPTSGGIISPRGSIQNCAAMNDAGITVPGSQSSQQFFRGEHFQTHDHTDVIVLHLRGAVAGKVVTRPVTVKSKPTCGTCGKSNKGGAQFCGNCGTSLVDYATR